MRKLIILMLLCSFQSANAQSDSLPTQKKPKEFIAFVQTTDGKLDKGLIHQLEDSLITIKTLPGQKTNFLSKKRRSEHSFKSYTQENIEIIWIERNKALQRGQSKDLDVRLLY